jgi:hypothetical protein
VIRLIRWNLSSRAAELSGGDALVVSIPKSGRTWVRTFLCAYFCKTCGHEFTLAPEQFRDQRIPRVIYSHDLFEQRTKADLWDRLRGKYLIPRRERNHKSVVLLARDPRDAFVSLFVQLTRRVQETPNELKEKSAAQLLRDRRYGIVSMIEIMNAWLREWSKRNDFLLLHYEALRDAAEEDFRRLLGLLDQASIDLEAFHHALEFSTFENMQKLEAASAFDSKILRARDTRDPESFKVRRGKVGGYEDYLGASDLEYVAAAMRELDPRFGYMA